MWKRTITRHYYSPIIKSDSDGASAEVPVGTAVAGKTAARRVAGEKSFILNSETSRSLAARFNERGRDKVVEYLQVFAEVWIMCGIQMGCIAKIE